jgi:hypothetical protein
MNTKLNIDSIEDGSIPLSKLAEDVGNVDPELNNKINGLQTQIDTLVSGDASSAIESFNEITAFLNGVEDTESLDGIMAGIEQQITNKQDTIADLDTIRSGAALGATALQNVKTINGNTIEGDGDVSVGSITSVDTGDILDDVDVRYATEQYVDDAIANVDVDTDNLATKEELTSLTNEMIANEEVHAAAYNDLDSRLKDVGSLISGVAVTKEELAAEVATINNVILENEEVHAAALNDLEERKADKTYVDEAIAQTIISTINANY